MEPFENLTIQEMRSHPDHRTFIVENPAGAFMEVNEPTATLLTCLKESGDKEEGIVRFGTLYPEMDASAVRVFIDDKLLKKMTDSSAQSRSFLYQRIILDGNTVDKIASRVCFLFGMKTGFICFVSALVLDIIYLLMAPNLVRFSGTIDATVMAVLFMSVIASSMFHELGHAAAARKFGLNTGGIGIGLYINFPVFYTDVTRVWRLSKRQRCIVNLSGIYFQLLMLFPIIILYRLTGAEILRYLVIVTNFSFILNLNPFFRFDGYWLISDIVGVPNLRKRSREVLKYIIARILRYHTTEVPYLLRVQGKVRYVLIFYAVIVNFFMLYYIFCIIPVFIYNFVQNIPAQTSQLIICLSNNITPPFALIRNLISELLFIIVICFMFYRSICNHVQRKSRNNPA